MEESGHASIVGARRRGQSRRDASRDRVREHRGERVSCRGAWLTSPPQPRRGRRFPTDGAARRALRGSQCDRAACEEPARTVAAAHRRTRGHPRRRRLPERTCVSDRTESVGACHGALSDRARRSVRTRQGIVRRRHADAVSSCRTSICAAPRCSCSRSVRWRMAWRRSAKACTACAAPRPSPAPERLSRRSGTSRIGVQRTLMTRFYSGLAAGQTRAEALRRAKLQLRRSPATSSFLYWAPVILSGSASALPTSLFHQ